MSDPWDDQFLKSGHEASEAQPRNRGGMWIVAVPLTVAAAVIAYFAFGGRLLPVRTPPAELPKPIAPPAARTEPLGVGAAPVDLPPLNESDALVRQLVRQLSSHPQVAAWLATNDLVRNFTLVVTNIAEGAPVAPALPALRPSSPFRVMERSDHRIYVDPRSYDRYAGFAQAVASIDPAGSARLYGTLKPRIEEAYVELGHQHMPFDRAFERAIVLLLDSPVPDGPLRVERGARGIVYVFADGRLEGLAVAQKQLLRMGPKNIRSIQSQLRTFAATIGLQAN